VLADGPSSGPDRYAPAGLKPDHDAEQSGLEADADERRRRGMTFRELAGSGSSNGTPKLGRGTLTSYSRGRPLLRADHVSRSNHGSEEADHD
jgi:hypothetical protein